MDWSGSGSIWKCYLGALAIWQGVYLFQMLGKTQKQHPGWENLNFAQAPSTSWGFPRKLLSWNWGEGGRCEYFLSARYNFGIPRGHSGKESVCQSRRRRIDPWVGKIPWRSFPGEGNVNPLQYFLPGKSHGQRSLVADSLLGCQELNTTE